jgi:argininosuccinate lyase
MIEFVSDLSSIMITLNRIAEDMIIWSSQEFGFIEIHDKHASTSSAMPQKKNPDPLELIRSKTAIVIGNLTSILTILKSLPSGYSRDLQDTKVPFWNSVDIVSSSLEIVYDVIASLIVNKDVIAKASNTSYAIALDIAEVLVMNYKIPFRIAHKLVGALVNTAINKKDGKSLKCLSSSDISEVLEKMKMKMPPGKLIQTIENCSPQKSIANRRSEGAPSPQQQIKTIKNYRLLLEKYVSEVGEKKKNVDSSKENITNTINLIKTKSSSQQ